MKPFCKIRSVLTGCLLSLALSVTPAHADVMRVVLLGTGMPRPSLERFGPAVLVEAGDHRLLFDAGRGVTQRLYQLRMPLNDVRQVFLTHLHSDHTVGLPDLWLTGWIWQRSEPLHVRGPQGTEAMLGYLQKAYSADIRARRAQTGLPAAGVKVIANNIEPGVVFKKGRLTVEAFRVDHRPIKPAFGYRVDYGDRSVVISGDTRFSHNLIGHAQDTDLLIHEVAAASKALLKRNPRLRKIMDYHTNPLQAGKVFQQSRPRLAVFTHLVVFGVSNKELLARARQHYDGRMLIGEDLMAFEIGDEITVRNLGTSPKPQPTH